MYIKQNSQGLFIWAKLLHLPDSGLASDTSPFYRKPFKSQFAFIWKIKLHSTLPVWWNFASQEVKFRPGEVKFSHTNAKLPVRWSKFELITMENQWCVNVVGFTSPLRPGIKIPYKQCLKFTSPASPGSGRWSNFAHINRPLLLTVLIKLHIAAFKTSPHSTG